METEWILFPICGNRARNRIREDTELKHFPLYCPKCRQESLVDVKGLAVRVIKDYQNQKGTDIICKIILHIVSKSCKEEAISGSVI